MHEGKNLYTLRNLYKLTARKNQQEEKKRKSHTDPKICARRASKSRNFKIYENIKKFEIICKSKDLLISCWFWHWIRSFEKYFHDQSCERYELLRHHQLRIDKIHHDSGSSDTRLVYLLWTKFQEGELLYNYWGRIKDL